MLSISQWYILYKIGISNLMYLYLTLGPLKTHEIRFKRL
jgi:hypothetical protein